MTLTASAPSPRRWQILAVIFIVRVAMGYQFQSAPSLTPFLVDAFKIDFASAGTLIGLYVLPGVVLALPGGVLTRWTGEKPMILGALVLMTAGGVLSGAGGFDAAWWGRLIAGCGVVLMFTVMTKSIGDWFRGRELFFAISLFLSGWPIGMGVGLLVQTPMADGIGWEWVFLSTGMFCAVSLLAFGALYPAHAASTGVPTSRFRLSGREFALVSLSGILWGVMNGAQLVVHSFAATYLERFMPRIEAAATVSGNVWAIIAAIPLGGLLLSRFGRPNTWLIGSTLLGGVCIVMIALDDNPLLWLSATGFLLFLPSGVVPVLPMEATRESTRNVGIGIFYAWWFACLAFLPPLAGWIADLTASTAAPLYVAASLVLFIPVLLGLFRWIQRGAVVEEG